MTIQTYIETLLRHMGVEGCEVSIQEIAEVADDKDEKGPPLSVFIKVSDDDMGIVVGRRAEGLIALQRVISVTFQEELAGRRVIVEVNDYRERRQTSLEQMADEYADRARRSGRPVRFPALSSEDRRMIHMMFRDSEEFETQSEGVGYDRRLMLYLRQSSEAGEEAGEGEGSHDDSTQEEIKNENQVDLENSAEVSEEGDNTDE